MANEKKTEKVDDIFGGFSPVRDILLRFIGSFFGNFIDQLQENITERVEEIQADLKVKAALFIKKAIQAFVIFFLLTFGAIFLFFGLANVLDYIFKIEGAGFLLVGSVMTFLGLIIAAISMRQK